MRWTCTTVRYGLHWCTPTRPPLVRTHTSNPAFPTGGGLGGFVFLACGGVGRRGRPRRGGWSHSPPVGKGGDVHNCHTYERARRGAAQRTRLSSDFTAARFTSVDLPASAWLPCRAGASRPSLRTEVYSAPEVADGTPLAPPAALHTVTISITQNEDRVVSHPEYHGHRATALHIRGP
jgi:hypothetical protein